MTAFKISKKEVVQPSPGEMLRQARIEKRLGFEEIEEATKIRIKYLEAVEKEQWQDLPNGPYTLGFLKSYSQYLGLPYQEIEERYKRENGAREILKKKNGDKKVIPERKEIKYPKIFLTPAILARALVVVVVVGVIGYIVYQILGFASAPYLLVNSPQTGATSLESTLIVEGKTQKGASLYLNGQLLGLDAEGNFKQEVILKDGSNSINITAVNKGGKKTEKNLIILYQAKGSEEQFSKEVIL